MTLPTDWRRGFLVDGASCLSVGFAGELGGLNDTPNRLASGVSGRWRELLKVVLRARLGGLDETLRRSRLTQVGEVINAETRNTTHPRDPRRKSAGYFIHETKPTQKHETQPTTRPPTQVGRERHPQIQANAETRNTTHPRDPRRKSAGSVIHQSKPTQKHETQPTRETPDASRPGASSIPPNQNSGRLNIAIDSDRNFDSSFK